MDASSNSPPPAAETALPPPPRRRRWLRRVVIGLAVVVAITVAAPFAIGLGPVRAAIERAVAARLRGPVRIDGLAWSWSSGVAVGGLEIGNPPGFPSERPALRLRTATVDIALGALLSGRTAVTAAIDGLELFVEQHADGATNLQALAPAGGVGRTTPPVATPSPPGGGTGAIAFDVALQHGLVEVRRDGELLEALRDLELTARSTGAAQQIAVDGRAKLLAGDVAIAATIDPDAGTVDARLQSRGVDLAHWQPLAAVFLPGQLTALAGKLDGELRAQVRGEQRVELGGQLAVAELRVAGPLVRDMDVRTQRGTIAPGLVMTRGAQSSLDVSALAIDLGFAQLHGAPAPAADRARLQYDVDIAALAAFGGPMPAALQGSGARVRGDLDLPTRDLPKDAAGWARAVAATANLVLAKLDVAGFALRDLTAAADLRDGACTVTTGDTTRLDGGALRASAQFDLTDLVRMPTKATLGWQKGQLSGGTTAALRYAMPLFAGLDPQAAGITGNCDLSLELTGPALKAAGQTWLTWLDEWRGNGALGLADASFAPASQLQGLFAPLGPLSQGLAPIGANGRLAIDSFHAPFSFADGVVRTTAGEWLAKGQRIGLSGTVGFGGALDYALDLTSLLKGHKDGERVLQALSGSLPAAKLGGTLDAPHLGLPDLGNIAQKLLEGELKQKGEELLKKGLEGLLKKKG